LQRFTTLAVENGHQLQIPNFAGTTVVKAAKPEKEKVGRGTASLSVFQIDK